MNKYPSTEEIAARVLRPPNDRGQGRKPLAKSGELMKTRNMRMTDAEWEKCKALGGSSWVRDKIAAAKVK